MKPFLKSLVLVFFVAACAVPNAVPPEDNDAFYQVAKSHRFATTKTFVVPRSLSAVASSFQKSAPRCLNAKKVITSYGPRSAGQSVSIYKPKISRKNGTVTLDVYRDGTKPLFGAPKGFIRTIMAEAKSVPGGTQIRIAGPSINFDDVYNAITEWSRGQSNRCPEFGV